MRRAFHATSATTRSILSSSDSNAPVRKVGTAMTMPAKCLISGGSDGTRTRGLRRDRPWDFPASSRRPLCKQSVHCSDDLLVIEDRQQLTQRGFSVGRTMRRIKVAREYGLRLGYGIEHHDHRWCVVDELKLFFVRHCSMLFEEPHACRCVRVDRL